MESRKERVNEKECLQSLQAKIADLEKENQILKDADEFKSLFLGNVSHDLRTPLNGIIGLSEIIQSQSKDPSVTSSAQGIIEESEVLLRLIGDILDRNKLESGKLRLENEKLNLPKFLDHIIQMVQLENRNRDNLQFKKELDPKLPKWIFTDPLRLQQILINLLGNAAKFTPKGHITLMARCIGTASDKVRVEFQITDTGIGIPKEYIDGIFNRYNQGSQSTPRQFGGSGLGTSIAQMLVSLMGGEINVTSEEGIGSTFSFTLEFSPKCKYILIVEDYLPNQKIMQHHLQNAGYAVTIVPNSEEAKRACQQNHYDLLIGRDPLQKKEITAKPIEVLHISQPIRRELFLEAVKEALTPAVELKSQRNGFKLGDILAGFSEPQLAH